MSLLSPHVPLLSVPSLTFQHRDLHTHPSPHPSLCPSCSPFFQLFFTVPLPLPLTPVPRKEAKLRTIRTRVIPIIGCAIFSHYRAKWVAFGMLRLGLGCVLRGMGGSGFGPLSSVRLASSAPPFVYQEMFKLDKSKDSTPYRRITDQHVSTTVVNGGCIASAHFLRD